MSVIRDLIDKHTLYLQPATQESFTEDRKKEGSVKHAYHCFNLLLLEPGIGSRSPEVVPADFGGGYQRVLNDK